MRNVIKIASVAVSIFSLITLAGCGGATDSVKTVSEPTQTKTQTVAVPLDATGTANQIKAGVSTVIKVVTLTEANDANNLIGRPNGYTSAAVLYDNAVAVGNGDKCDDFGGPGVDCGATVEVWSSNADANARAKYIQTLQKGSAMLGSEWDYIGGGVLVRVSGKLKPSEAKNYNKVFGGTLFTL